MHTTRTAAAGRKITVAQTSGSGKKSTSDSRSITMSMRPMSKSRWRTELSLSPAAGGNRGSGNSDRKSDRIGGMRDRFTEMSAQQIVIVDLTSGQATHLREAPSYELPMHRVVYRQMQNVAAIVHTTLSVLRSPLPPVIDEMMVYFGGTIDVADYAFTGTEELGENVVCALGDHSAVLLANHGNVCVGRDIETALHTAITMEAAARVYVQALQIGEPIALPDSSIEAARGMFRHRTRDRR